jgi:aspartokinase-like uncharacterized kinase
MNRKFLRVAKVGGSLFDYPELPATLRGWLDIQPGCTVLIAGGGPLAEAIREVDTTFRLTEAAAHRLAIEAMRVSAELLVSLLPETPLVRSIADARARLPTHTVVILDAAELLASPECSLPSNWDVTSDSIAAHVASELGAHELVLFKSTALPANTSRIQAAEMVLVDRYFVEAALNCSAVRWVNLRQTPVTERPL